MPPTPCPMCGSFGKKSREHWLPRSWGARIPSPKVLLDTKVDEGEVQSFKLAERSPFGQPYSGICTSCNNGWLREVDEAAEDVAVNLALGEYSEVNAGERLPLARSLARAALVLLWGRRNDSPFPLESMREFEATRNPPSRMTILLGRPEGAFATHAGGHVAVMRAEVEGETVPFIALVGFSIGVLYVMVVLPIQGAEWVGRDVVRAVKRAAGGRLAQLWPSPRRSRLAIPRGPLTDDELRTLTSVRTLLLGAPVPPRADASEVLEGRLARYNGDFSPMVQKAVKRIPPKR